MQEVLSIDNEKPTTEDLMEIDQTRCLKCGELASDCGSRIIFVRVKGKLMWWHGLINRSEFPCMSVFEGPKNPPKKVKYKASRKCLTCGIIIGDDARISYCSDQCRQYVKQPKKSWIADFLGV